MQLLDSIPINMHVCDVSIHIDLVGQFIPIGIKLSEWLASQTLNVYIHFEAQRSKPFQTTTTTYQVIDIFVQKQVTISGFYKVANIITNRNMIYNIFNIYKAFKSFNRSIQNAPGWYRNNTFMRLDQRDAVQWFKLNGECNGGGGAEWIRLNNTIINGSNKIANSSRTIRVYSDLRYMEKICLAHSHLRRYLRIHIWFEI